jgi:hypothetical protein
VYIVLHFVFHCVLHFVFHCEAMHSLAESFLDSYYFFALPNHVVMNIPGHLSFPKRVLVQNCRMKCPEVVVLLK